VYKDYVGELGAKHARLQSGWAKTEKEKGKYDFAWLDYHVKGLTEQSVRPWICLCYGNPIYGSTINLGSGLAPVVHSEEAFAAWLKYVETTVTRYKASVNEWEIWNEPFGQGKDYASWCSRPLRSSRNIQPTPSFWSRRSPTKTARTCWTRSRTRTAWTSSISGRITRIRETLTPLRMGREVSEAAGPTVRNTALPGEGRLPSILEWTHALAHYPGRSTARPSGTCAAWPGDRVRNYPVQRVHNDRPRYTNMQQSFGMNPLQPAAPVHLQAGRPFTPCAT
jgi:hypothetical protein